MPSNFFEDPGFMEEMKVENERLDELARSTGKDIQDVVKAEIDKSLDNLEAFIAEGVASYKKDEWRKKSGSLPSFAEVFERSFALESQLDDLAG